MSFCISCSPRNKPPTLPFNHVSKFFLLKNHRSMFRRACYYAPEFPPVLVSCIQSWRCWTHFSNRTWKWGSGWVALVAAYSPTSTHPPLPPTTPPATSPPRYNDTCICSGLFLVTAKGWSHMNYPYISLWDWEQMEKFPPPSSDQLWLRPTIRMIAATRAFTSIQKEILYSHQKIKIQADWCARSSCKTCKTIIVYSFTRFGSVI